MDSIHLRKSLSHLLLVAPCFVCCATISWLSRASIAARCARIFSAIAESDVSELVDDDMRLLKLELLFATVAEKALFAIVSPQTTLNKTKKFNFVFFVIFLLYSCASRFIKFTQSVCDCFAIFAIVACVVFAYGFNAFVKIRIVFAA